jgi:hypothetical protein
VQAILSSLLEEGLGLTEILFLAVLLLGDVSQSLDSGIPQAVTESRG